LELNLKKNEKEDEKKEDTGETAFKRPSKVEYLKRLK